MATIEQLTERAAKINLIYRGDAISGKTKTRLLFIYEPNDTAQTWFSTGAFDTKQAAIDFSYAAFDTSEDDLVKLLKNNKLFPHIRGVMIKDRSFVLTLSGKVNVTEMQGGDARVEIFFLDHPKSAVINRNQALNIIDMYGDETGDWKGKPVTLYAERGKWFGKMQWGVRVSATPPKAKASAKDNNGPEWDELAGTDEEE